MRRPLILLLALLTGAAPLAAADGPKKDLRSKDWKVRLAAVETLRKEGGEDAEELLVDALGDRDWEVVEAAVVALGERGGEDSVKPLLKEALIGPVRRIRLAAARALMLVDPEAAEERLAKRVIGETAEAACEALVTVAAAKSRTPGDELRKGLLRGLASKELPVRVAAARGITAFAGRERRELFDRILAMPETSVRAAALNALIENPDPDLVPALVGLLDTEGLSDVLSRRVIAALRAVVAAAPAGEERDRLARGSVAGVEMAGSPRAEDDGDGDPPLPPPLVAAEQVEPALEVALAHEDEAVRAAAVHALGRIRTAKLLGRAAAMAKSDASARVRLHALRAVAGALGTEDEATRDLLIDRLGKDAAPPVREYAAVALGVRGLAAAVAPLAKALRDESWEVAVCAAVSLGKTGDPGGVSPLRTLAGERDWKLRAAAVVGLGHLRIKRVVPNIIEALGEKDSSVVRSAWEILKRYAQKELEPTVRVWMGWWNEVKDGFEFLDREKMARDAKKYGYAPGYRGVYEDLDVVVLQSRGDTIEHLLERLTIRHRLTRSGQVSDAGLHPYAVFVANCTGEIVEKDVERLSWFVRTGGYLFGSCWALHETIELVYPGVVRKLPIPGQVLANVLVEPCPEESPYLEGVFGDGIVRPIYVLWGSHLIEVLDPERVEVLIDSPQTADTWPEGNLACWFDAGHGVILDSANHFDLQGFDRVTGLKTAEDRMGYAMDHMGLGYADLRELAKKRIWGSQSKATKEAKDLSAFRFITNFVRRKRKVDR